MPTDNNNKNIKNIVDNSVQNNNSNNQNKPIGILRSLNKNHKRIICLS